MTEESPNAIEGAFHLQDEATALERLRETEAELERLRATTMRGEELLIERLATLERELKAGQGGPPALKHSLFSRAVRKLWRSQSLIRRPVATSSDAVVQPHPSVLFPEDHRYSTWIDCYDTLDDDIRDVIRNRLATIDGPMISVLLPVFNTPESYLREAIESIMSQLYQNWEICIADDASTAPWVTKVLDEYAKLDARIKVTHRRENGHISCATNSAFEMAIGSWVALFDHDDILPEHALALCALAIARQGDAGIIYTDEDHIDDSGARSAPYMKPDFDPILILGQNYCSHLCLVRSDLVERAGKFREGYEGSQDWDLVLRVLSLIEARQVVHVPHVLYHWRTHPGSTAFSLAAKPYAAVAAKRAVEDHLERCRTDSTVTNIAGSGFTRIHWEIPATPPRVSVVVLPRGGPSFMRCVDGVKIRSTYPDIEIVIVDDGGQRAPLRQFLRDWGDGFTVVRETRDLSDSALRNAGARASSGDVLCFLHEDVEVLTDRWLEEMIGLLLQPTIGVVGAKLLYEDRTIQHAGIVVGMCGAVGHIHRNFDSLEFGYFGRAALAQCFSAVSCACMVVRRDVFDEVGGFDEERCQSVFGDVDLCLRIAERGRRTAWTPFAELLHHEPRDSPRETQGENAIRFARDIRYLQQRWADWFLRDPAYSPNLSLLHETFPLAWPPRASFK